MNNDKGFKKLLIIGASGHGRVAADIAMKMNCWSEIYFLDDNTNLTSSMGIKVIGSSRDAVHYIKDHDIFIAIGDNKTREKIFKQMELAGASLPVLMHPNVTIGFDVEIGAGTVIVPGVIINCCSRVGRGCIINTSATLGHDSQIGDFVHVSPGARVAGTVTVGNRTWLCAGSIVINNINITADCLVGAGAVVVNDILEAGTYLGVPARRMQNYENTSISK